MSKRAAIYTRISDDALGEGLGVQRQEEDCRALAHTKGYETTAVYSDNDISAAGEVKRERPQWNTLLADAKSGNFDVILAYSNSRLTRRLAELEVLIQLHETTGVVIETVVSGNDDLSTADGRMVARIKASVDAAEAERVGERVSRAAKQRAANGIPQKGRTRLFGYSRDWEVVEDEKKVIVECFERRASGESTTSIAKDLTKRGIKTVAGNDWKSGTLGVTLTKPIYCGLREYKGEIIGASAVPAFVDKPLWDAAQRNLANDKKGTNARKYLLSGILRCGHCLSPMKGNPSNKMYRCSTTYRGCGRLSVRIESADPYVFHAAFEKYARTVGNAKEHTVVDYATQIQVVETEIANLQASHRAEVYTLKEVLPLIKAARSRLKELEKKAAVQRPSVPKIQRKFLDWYKMGVSEKRVFIGDYIENVVVHPAETKGKHFDPTRLEAHYTDGTKERLQPYVDWDPNDDPEGS